MFGFVGADAQALTEQQKNRPKPVRFKAEDIVHENGYDIEKSDGMDEMLFGRGGIPMDDVDSWIKRFCERKWTTSKWRSKL